MNTHTNSVAARAREALKKMGTASVAQIAMELGIRDTRPVGQGLGAETRRPGSRVVRVSRGVYRWDASDPGWSEGTPEDLRPLIENLGAPDFDLVDLTYVARTQDGGFICTDRNGVAWKVEVAVSARMM
jgi:hypothetical protein